MVLTAVEVHTTIEPPSSSFGSLSEPLDEQQPIRTL